MVNTSSAICRSSCVYHKYRKQLRSNLKSIPQKPSATLQRKHTHTHSRLSRTHARPAARTHSRPHTHTRRALRQSIASISVRLHQCAFLLPPDLFAAIKTEEATAYATAECPLMSERAARGMGERRDMCAPRRIRCVCVGKTQ